MGVLLIGGLAAVLKWTFGGDMTGPPSAVNEPEGSDDFGLLTPVAVVDTQVEADQLRAQLQAAAIRSTVGQAPNGRHRVLVFEADVARARRALPT